VAIVAESSSTALSDASADNIAFDKPTGLANGDVLVAVVRAAAAPTISPPDGSWGEFAQNPVTNRTIGMFYKVISNAAGEPATYTFTFSGSVGFRGGGLIRFSGVNTTTPSDCTASVRSGTATTHTYGSITTVTDGAMLIGCVTSNSTSLDPTPPAEMAELWQITRTAFANGIKATAGATGDLTGTQSSLNLNYNTVFGALRPASAGGGSAEGTLSATLGALTASATGAIALDGDLTATLSALLLSAVAALDITGDLTATLGALALNADGEVAITADLSATLDALTLSATGELVTGANGSLTATLGALTANAAGELALQAALTQALEALTATAAGALALTGDVDATLGALTLSAEGTLTAGPSGQLAATLGALTAQATGAIALTAQATVALGALTLNANGEMVLTGQAIIVLAALTLSAQGGETAAAVTYVYGTITGPAATGTAQGPATTGTIGG
jgi:hypothetical protein